MPNKGRRHDDQDDNVGDTVPSSASVSSSVDTGRSIRSLLNRAKRSGGVSHEDGGGEDDDDDVANADKDNDDDEFRRRHRRRRDYARRHVLPPPDEAGYALGSALAEEVHALYFRATTASSLKGGTEGRGGGGVADEDAAAAAAAEAEAEVMDTLCSTYGMNPAVPRGYFRGLSDLERSYEEEEEEERARTGAGAGGLRQRSNVRRQLLAWEGRVLRCEESLIAASMEIRGSGGVGRDRAAVASSSEALAAAIRSFASRSVECRRRCKDQDGEGDGEGDGEESFGARGRGSGANIHVGGKSAAATYARLKTGPARRALLRECALAAIRFGAGEAAANTKRKMGADRGGEVGGDGNVNREEGRIIDERGSAEEMARFLSPLLASSALDPARPMGERAVLVRAVLGEFCSSSISPVRLEILVPWLTRVLERLLDRGPRVSLAAAGAAVVDDDNVDVDNVEEDFCDFAHDFFLRLSDLARILSAAAAAAPSSPDQSRRWAAVSAFVDAALGSILPRLSSHRGGGHCVRPLRPALDRILDVLPSSQLVAKNARPSSSSPIATFPPEVAPSDAAVFRTAVLCLTLTDKEETVGGLCVLAGLCSSGAIIGDLIRGVAYGVGCIHADGGSGRDGDGASGQCAGEAEALLRCLAVSEERDCGKSNGSWKRGGIGGKVGGSGLGKSEENGTHLITLLQRLRDDGASDDLSKVVLAMFPPPPASTASTDDSRGGGRGDGDDVGANHASDPMSPALRSSALLVGIALYQAYGPESDLARTFLSGLLGRHPRLGVRLLPVLIRSVRDAAARHGPDPREALSALTFLCGPVVRDPDCAYRIWSLLSDLSCPPRGGVGSVRAAIARLYPALVRSNRRLYGRVRDAIGPMIVHPDAEVRLAAAATVSDLAEEDLIRDASDAAPWIQGRLSDEEPAVTYFALIALHHLIRSGEMDFDAVIKVLNRRMPCRVDDVESALKLDGLVLEGLATILGDGQCGGYDEEEDIDDDRRRCEVVVSAQVRAAVRALVGMGLSPRLAAPSTGDTGPGGEEGLSAPARRRIRERVRASLAEYSDEALGLAADAVEAAASLSGKGAADEEGVERLRALRSIAAGALDGTELGEIGSDAALDSLPPLTLAEKLLAFEQETLGSDLFKGAGGDGAGRRAGADSFSGRADKNQASRSATSALPKRSIVEGIYRSNPCTITSVASLLCFGVDSSPRKYGEMFSELEEIVSDCAMFGDIADPVLVAIALQGYVQAMGKLWHVIHHGVGARGSIEDAAREVMQRIMSWRDVIGEPDVAFVALAAFVLCVPDCCGDGSGGNAVDLTGFVESARECILSAHRNGSFSDDDAAHICLGILGVRLLNSMELKRVSEIVDALVQATNWDEMGNQCFGAFYGLALIAQASMTVKPSLVAAEYGTSASSKSFPVATLRRIASLLLEKIHSCLQESCTPILGLIACIAGDGGPFSDITQSVRCIDDKALLLREGARFKFRCLCVALALCSRPLGELDKNLLSGIHCLMEKFPNGSGNGIILASANQSIVGWKDQKQQDGIFDRYSKLVNELLDGGKAVGLDDAFWGVVRDIELLSKSPQHKNLIIEWVNRAVDVDGVQVSSFVALLGMMGTIPALALSRNPFGFPVELRPYVKKELISSATQILSKCTVSVANTNCWEGTALALGLLCGMKSSIKTLGYSPIVASMHMKEGSEKRMAGIQAKQIPKAREGSFLRQIFDLLGKCCQYDSERKNELQILLILKMLRVVALPSQFCATIEWLLSLHFNGNESIKRACIDLLASRINSRNRFGMDARGYIQFFSRLSRLPYDSFVDILGCKSGPFAFMSLLFDSIPKLPSGSIRALLENLWAIALEVDSKPRSPETTKKFCDASCVHAFLRSLRGILRNRKKAHTKKDAAGKKLESLVAPAALTDIRSLIVDKCFRDLQSRTCMPPASGFYMDARYFHFIWQSYFSCVQLVPYHLLEEKELLRTSASETLASSLVRINCTVYLASQGYFADKSRELQRAASWIVRQKGNRSVRGNPAEQMIELNLAAFNLAVASAFEGAASQKEFISHILEVLLVEGDENASVVTLSFAVSFWEKKAMLGFKDPSLDMISVLSALFERATATAYFRGVSKENFCHLTNLFLEDFPRSFSRMCAELGIIGSVANRLTRILSSDLGQRKNERLLQYTSLLNQRVISGADAMAQNLIDPLLSKAIPKTTSSLPI